MARLNDVRAFGYNSAGSERICMKFGELRVYGLGLSLTNFGRDPRRSGFGRKSRNFVFFPSIKQRAISPTSGRPNFTKFAQKDVFPCPLLALWKICENLPVRGIFSQKNSIMPKIVRVLLRGGGWHSYTIYGCTLSPLGEYYVPPKLLTAAAMRSYVKLL